jgi:hypothetical protein
MIAKETKWLPLKYAFLTFRYIYWGVVILVILGRISFMIGDALLVNVKDMIPKFIIGAAFLTLGVLLLGFLAAAVEFLIGQGVKMTLIIIGSIILIVGILVGIGGIVHYVVPNNETAPHKWGMALLEYGGIGFISVFIIAMAIAFIVIIYYGVKEDYQGWRKQEEAQIQKIHA